MDEMWEKIEDIKSNGWSPNQYHKEMYRFFFLLIHGHVGKGNRIALPTCVVDTVKHQFPAPGGKYMGFKPTIKEEGESNDSD